ncbi:hypothetical protein PTTG_25565 [Puccinia triticina 1-1 BBBD Race 1]|uniref:Uncharacterized protein n=1 Tax=Puccinia triticina (isolate 1-1 / race 1 (BBBD)) TaxID=630390 RepID=A0A180H2S9_PUCT1|nr:hypothetical protein PTTG_25565 [Puccinia triticina 1-1 BBBD Race 1]WAR58521.1 hypothetical protein PtB15_5B755 [Puccinia triticina]
MKNILLLAVYCLPVTQCMLLDDVGTKGKNIASNHEINSTSPARLTTHSSKFEETIDPRSQVIPGTTHLDTTEELDALEFIETIPQLRLRPQGREKGANLARNQVADPNSSKGRRTLMELLLQDLNSIRKDSPEIGRNYNEFGHEGPLIEALEDVDKLLLIHIKHRLSVLASGRVKLPSCKKGFPALRILDHGNILRNVYSPQHKVVVPIGKSVKKCFKDVSKGFRSIFGRTEFRDIPTHCKDTKPPKSKLSRCQSPPVLEEQMSHRDNCQFPMSLESLKLVGKLRILDEELDSIEGFEGNLQMRFRILYSKAINFMYKHELITVGNVQSLFGKNNLEYAASHMTSLNDCYHIQADYDEAKFWYPTTTEGVYNRWYTSDFMNFFTVLQKEQQDYFSYYLLFLKAKYYLHELPHSLKQGRFQEGMHNLFASFTSIDPDEYFKERANALATIQPEIQEAVQLFKVLKDDVSDQESGLAIILLSQFFEFLQGYHPGMFLITKDHDPDMIRDLKLMGLSKQLITEVDKFSTYIFQNYRTTPNGEHSQTVLERYARESLAELDKLSTHVERMIEEHSKAVWSVLQGQSINHYFLQPFVDREIKCLGGFTAYLKEVYSSELSV